MDKKDKAVSSIEPSTQKISYTIAPNNELRVRYVNQDIMRRLFNVAHKEGCTTTMLVKRHLKDILKMYPPEYQNDTLNDGY